MHELKLTHRCWAFDTPGKHAAGGLLIFCKRAFLSKFNVIEDQLVIPGRIAGIKLLGNAGALQLSNVHAEPILNAERRIDQLSRLRDACGSTVICQNVLAGDFNFVLEAEDRYRPALKRFSGQRQADGTYFLDNFRDFVEAMQSEHTRQGGHGAATVLSRLDRIYVTLGAWETNDFNMRVSAQKDLNVIKQLPDHVPVCALISHKTFGGGDFGSPQIPSWISKHSCWPSRLATHFKQLEVLCPGIPTTALG